MNILPKKRWHVRTKDNIARIRRDEAKAEEEEQERLRRKHLAEKEARINKLRHRKGCKEIQKSRNYQQEVRSGHVNLFEDYEVGLNQQNAINKKCKDQFGKNQSNGVQMVLPTFLGQGTNEALKIKSWYELPPQRLSQGSIYSGKKICEMNENNSNKNKQDKSETIVKAEVGKISITSVHKELEKIKEKTQNAKVDASRSLENMRKDRLKREALEKSRQELTLLKAQGLIIEAGQSCVPKKAIVKPKYSSQFNPHIARQNMK